MVDNSKPSKDETSNALGSGDQMFKAASRRPRMRLSKEDRESIKPLAGEVKSHTFSGQSVQESRSTETKLDESRATTETHRSSNGADFDPQELPWKSKGFISEDHRGKVIKRGINPKLPADVLEMLFWLSEDKTCIKSQVSFIQDVCEKAVRERVAEELIKDGLERTVAKELAGLTYTKRKRQR